MNFMGYLREMSKGDLVLLIILSIQGLIFLPLYIVWVIALIRYKIAYRDWCNAIADARANYRRAGGTGVSEMRSSRTSGGARVVEYLEGWQFKE